MDIDEQAILAFKEMADKKILGFFESRDSEDPDSSRPLREWIKGLGIKDFSFDWTCVQFLDPDHVMVKVQGQNFSDVRGRKCHFGDFFLLVPKDIVEKSLVLGELS